MYNTYMSYGWGKDRDTKLAIFFGYLIILFLLLICAPLFENEESNTFKRYKEFKNKNTKKNLPRRPDR